jgi:alpha-galactosidase/6-phospho-beta-glucosidase family protein
MFFGRDRFKFVFIGAGSSVFTLKLTGDILTEVSVSGGSLVLVDIDEKNLNRQPVERGSLSLIKKKFF